MEKQKFKTASVRDEKVKVRHKIKILGYQGEEIELLIERYGAHDNLSVWHKGRELFGMHFTRDFLSVFPEDSRAVKYVCIPSRGTQIIVKER